MTKSAYLYFCDSLSIPIHGHWAIYMMHKGGKRKEYVHVHSRNRLMHHTVSGLSIYEICRQVCKLATQAGAKCYSPKTNFYHFWKRSAIAVQMYVIEGNLRES